MRTEAELYALLRHLDRLETLREDLYEVALRGGVGGESLDEDDEIEPLDEQALTAELTALGLASLADVEAAIAALHAQLDAEGG